MKYPAYFGYERNFSFFAKRTYFFRRKESSRQEGHQAVQFLLKFKSKFIAILSKFCETLGFNYPARNRVDC